MCNHNGVFITTGARYVQFIIHAQSDVHAFQSWFQCSYLGVNIGKTKVLYLPVGYNKPLYQLFSDSHSKQPGPGLDRLRIRISSCFVGLTVDSSLSYKAHVNLKCATRLMIKLPLVGEYEIYNCRSDG